MKSSAVVFGGFKELINIHTEQFPTALELTCLPKFDEELLLGLIEEFIEIIKEEKTVLEINENVVVVGDIHGNLQDLIRILTKFGLPPQTSYLFLGDYIDRGSFSVEVIVLLMALKCRFPYCINLLRGNHEVSHINKAYGFYDDIKDMYDNLELYARFNESFNYMSLAAIIRGCIFCVHGGISERLNSIGDLTSIKKPIDADIKLVEDLLWSDPGDNMYFCSNHRGKGITYGVKATQSFLENTNMHYIVRAHECVENGIRIKNNIITVFSSSHYSNPSNSCAVLIINEKEIGKHIFPMVPQFKKEDATYFHVMKTYRSIPTTPSLRTLKYKQSLSSTSLFNPHGGRRSKDCPVPQIPHRSSLPVLPKMTQNVKISPLIQ